MSICRWSPHSDIYAYEAFDGGFTINVSGRRKLPHAGEGWARLSAADALAKLLELQELGYVVPFWAIAFFENEVQQKSD